MITSQRQDRAIGFVLSAVLPGSEMENYDVSHDGKQVAFSLRDQQGISHMWLSPTDHRSSPHVRVCYQPGLAVFSSRWRFGVAFRGRMGQNFVYRTRQDGTDRRKVIPDPVLDVGSISPDGRWVVAGANRPDAEHQAVLEPHPVDGGPSPHLCNTLCEPRWDISGKFFRSSFSALRVI